MAKEIHCDCPDKGYPLCRYCSDDQYCPQCGKQLAGVVSANQQPANGGPVWIYPNEQHEFVFPLTLLCADARREQDERTPDMDLNECVLKKCRTEFFTRQIAEAGPGRFKLVPSPEVLKNKPETWYHDLPPEGLSGSLELKGDFPDKTLDVRICGPVSCRVSVEGEGVYATQSDMDSGAGAIDSKSAIFDEGAQDADWRIWQGSVWKFQKLPLTVKLEALTAPVYFHDEVNEILGETEGELESSIPAGTVLEPTPKGQPLEFKLTADFRNWDNTSEKSIFFQLPFELPQSEYIQLNFRRVKRGARYSCGSSYSIETLHFGEVLRSQEWEPVTIINIGEETLHLSDPEVINVQGISNSDWISARWDRSARGLELRPGDERSLFLILDGSRLSKEDSIGDQPIAATIAVHDREHAGISFQLDVDVLRVTQAPDLGQDLIIDFGNTNTYVAIRDKRREAIPLLGAEEAAELYPTILYFEDVSDETEPKYQVGSDALVGAKKCPAAAVVGIKRWIGVQEGGMARRRPIRDAKGNKAYYDFPEIARFYLEGVIRKCEKHVRKRVSRVGLTFPVKYTDFRVDAFRQIGNSLKSRFVSKEHDGPDYQVAVELDEASAVALDFLFDTKIRAEYIQPLVQEQRSDVVIGSVDFGGGTIDTALLRFSWNGPFGLSRITSTFLDFGGDPNLGGDNITVAVMEMLQTRLAACISAADANFGEIHAVDPNRSSNGGRRQPAPERDQNNFRILWDLSEATKKFLCSAEWRHRNRDREASIQQDVDAMRREIVESLNAQLGQLVSVADHRLEDSLDVWNVVAEAIAEPDFLMNLDEVYDHTVQQDLRGSSGYTIRDKLTQCVRELSNASDRTPIDFLVMAGASCHVPLAHDLVNEILKTKFPKLRIYYDHRRPKSKVAFGAVRYFFAKQHHASLLDVQPSTHFVRRAIGGVNLFGVFLDWIPTCVLVKSENWFHLPPGIMLSLFPDRIVQLYVAGAEAGNETYSPYGYFDLNKPANLEAAKEPDADSGTLPPDLDPEHIVSLRLNGSTSQILLKVESGGKKYGCWSMQPGSGSGDGPATL
ncbi:MAG: hypothetical protein ACC628_09350 [Pirellulaceae bacterium]